MAIPILILTIKLHLFTLSFCEIYCGDVKQQVINVDSIVNSINQQNYDVIYKNIYDEFSSEGSELIGFCDENQQLCKLIVTHFGEMGKMYQEYYLYQDSLIYQKQISYKYNKPFYEEDHIVMVDSVSCNCIINPNQCNKSDFNMIKNKISCK